MKRFSLALFGKYATQTAISLTYSMVLANFMIGLPVNGAIRTWDGSSNGDWAVGANWSGNTAPVAGDALVFPAGVTQTFMSNNLPANLLISAITFRGSNYSVGGNAITLSGGITCEQRTNGNTLGIGIILSASQTFQCTNAGGTFHVVELAGSFAGLNLQTNTLTVDGPGTIEIGSGIGGTGGVTKQGSGLLTYTDQTDTYTGQTWIRAGTLVVAKAFAKTTLPGPTIVGDASDSSFLTDTLVISGTGLALAGDVTVGPTGLLAVHDIFHMHTLTVNGGQVETSGSGLLLCDEIDATSVVVLEGINLVPRSASISGNLETGAGTITFDVSDGPASPDLVVAGPIGGNPTDSIDETSIVKEGPGDMAFTGTNIYGGTSTISGGLLRIDNSHGLATNSVTINGSGTLQLNGVIMNKMALTISSRSTNPGALFATGSSNAWTGSISNSQPAAHVNVDTNSTLNLSGAISGTGGLVKDGLGTLILSGSASNTYSGATTVRGGLLQLGKTGGALALQGSTLTIGDSFDGNATDTVRYLAGSQMSVGVDIFINRTGLLDLNGFTDDLGDINLDGGVIQTGSGTLQLRGNVTAIGDLSGLTFFNAQISGRLDLGISTRSFTVNNNPFLGGALVDLVVDATISGSGGITKTGAGELELNGTNTYTGSTIVNDGELIVGNNAALGSASPGTTVNDPGRILLSGGISVAAEPLTLNTTAANPGALFGTGPSNYWGGNIFLNQTSHIGVETNSILNLAGAIIGPAGLIKEDDGELIFSGSASNSYGGTTIVNGGTLFLNKLGVDFAIPGDLVIGDGIGGTNADVVFYSFDQINDSSHVTVNSSGILSVGSDTIGSVSGAGNLQVLNTGSLRTGGNNASTTLSGVISGGGTLTKRGAGTFTLNANNTYTGDTTVEAGTLAVNGSQSGSDITVLAGATLGGSGRVGALSVATGGHVAPGSSPGRLTASSTVLSNNAVLHIELNGPTAGTTYDQLQVFGTANLTGSKLAPSLGFAPFDGQVFTILDNDGVDAVTGTFDNLANGAVTNVNGIQMRISYSGITGNDVTLTVTNLPARASTATVATGNGDGRIDPNECNQLFLRVTNATGVPLTNVQATLSSTTPGVVITRPTSAYPDMKTLGAAGTNLTAFQFFTDTGFLCGESIEFLLTLSASNQAPFAARYVLESGTLTASQSFTNNSGVGIPSSGAVFSPIVVSGMTGSVAKVTVSMSLFHQNLAELEIFLIPPGGPAIPLAISLPGTQLGTNCANGRVTFDDDAAQPLEAGGSPYVGTFRPDSALRIADGDSGPALNGVWMIEVLDFVPNSSVGALSCWSLSITPATCAAGGGSCAVCNGPFFGSITASDTAMATTIPSSGPVSACGVPKSCPGVIAGPSHFDTFTFTNASGPACVTVTLDSPCLGTSTNPIGCAAYSGTFNPANPCQNYLGDIGDFLTTPASFSFNVPSNGVFLVVVDGATNLDCPNYVLHVDGFDCPLRLGANSVASGGAIAINWPNYANGFNLESTTNLALPIWLPVTNQPVSSGPNFIVTNNITLPRAFYRLHKP